MSHDELLKRLRRPEHLQQLADLAARELLEARVGEVVRPAAVANCLASLSLSHLRSPGSARPIEEVVERVLRRLESDAAPLHEWTPKELQDALRELASLQHTPDREVVLTVLDHEPLRAAVRDVLRESLLGFAEKLRAPVADSAVARGIGSLTRFARDQAIARSGAIGTIAASVGSAVGAEVERQIDRRAAEYADSVLSGVIERIAERMSDPSRAAERAAIRTALLDGFLDLYTDELAAELRRSDPGAASQAVRRALLAWLESDRAAETLASAIEALVRPDAERTLAEVLGDLGMREEFERAAADLLRSRLEPLVRSEAFAASLGHLMAAP